jgi:hypothetical protein
MTVTHQDRAASDPASDTSELLRGTLRRQGIDYLLEERHDSTASPWVTGRIWRVASGSAAPVALADALDRDIVARATPRYLSTRAHMVMEISQFHVA